MAKRAAQRLSEMLATRTACVLLTAAALVTVACGQPDAQTAANAAPSTSAAAQTRIASADTPLLKGTSTPNQDSVRVIVEESDDQSRTHPTTSQVELATGVAAKKSHAPTLLTRDDGPEESEFTFERRGQPEGGARSTGVDSMASARGPTYRWQDGEHMRSVRLQTDLIVATRSTRDQRAGEVVRKASEHAAGQSNPVFRTESGEVMTLPGGVLLALDQAWAQSQIDSFFATNGIDRSRVSDRNFAVNAFFIDTNPGFPSLDLANALAGQNGVLIASPNWQREVATR